MHSDTWGNVSSFFHFLLQQEKSMWTISHLSRGLVGIVQPGGRNNGQLVLFSLAHQIYASSGKRVDLSLFLWRHPSYTSQKLLFYVIFDQSCEGNISLLSSPSVTCIHHWCWHRVPPRWTEQTGDAQKTKHPQHKKPRQQHQSQSCFRWFCPYAAYTHKSCLYKSDGFWKALVQGFSCGASHWDLWNMLFQNLSS